MRSDYISKTVIEDSCKCAGVFLLKHQDDKLHVLLVESKQKHYKYSFPKGKRNKGEDTLSAARRELYEETGITEKDYELFPNRWYIEYGPDTEKPHIVYYFAILKNKDVILDPQDKREIVSANWFLPDDIYEMKKTFSPHRKRIVTRAVRDFKFKNMLKLASVQKRDYYNGMSEAKTQYRPVQLVPQLQA